MKVHYKRSQLSLYSSSDFFILHVYQADTLTTYSQYQLYPTYNPVSYTHLDVYKRQVLPISIAALIGERR